MPDYIEVHLELRVDRDLDGVPSIINGTWSVDSAKLTEAWEKAQDAFQAIADPEKPA